MKNVELSWHAEPLEDERTRFTIVLEDYAKRALTEACKKHGRLIHVFDGKKGLYDFRFKCPECEKEEADADKE